MSELAPIEFYSGTDPDLQNLLDLVRYEVPDMDTEPLERAYHFAEQAHGAERRRSGEPFITHPVEVAMILARMQLDQETLVAALLHDVVEDTGFSVKDIEDEFGATVANLVAGVTKLGKIAWTSDDDATQQAAREKERQAESLRKMFLAMVDDVRVVLIKLADRLHNMRTLEHMPEDKQVRSARETIEIYAPLANRLGILQIRSELEDLAFRYLNPQEYFSIDRAIDRRTSDRVAFLDRFETDLREHFSDAGVTATLEKREKHLYSIWRKMQRKDVSFDEIYDVFGFRVVVDSKQDCYAAPGVIHSNWHPIPGEFDDDIATPKESLYQSIHTAVIGPGGTPVEIQIRTQEMHRVAEYGIAAHWRYKESGKIDLHVERKVAWLRNLMDWRDEIADAQEFVESLKSDVFQEMIYVFTPAGDIIELPDGATPVDFAYRIHTEVGHQCVGAKVNDQMVPLDHKLTNGSVVRVLTSNTKVGPSRDWLMPSNGYVVTASAREKIRQWFRRQERDENIAQGREILERELRRLNVTDAKYEDIAKMFPSFQRAEDFLAAIGYGGISPQQIATKLVEDNEPDVLPPAPSTNDQRSLIARGIQVMGVGDLYTRLGNCCKPVYGDDIVGYTTRGRGITVHRSDCPNVRNVDDEARLVNVSWGQERESYPVTVRVVAWDRVGLLRDLTTLVSDEGLNMDSVLTQTHPDQTVTVLITLTVDDVRQLSRVLQKLETLRDVFDVRRENPLGKSQEQAETSTAQATGGD
ncbi:GTP diphosphokinase [soil metagenome]